MLVVPADTPVTTPNASIVPAPVLLVQVPPAGVEFNEVVNPTQTLVVPVIAVGFALTVTNAVTRQPVPSVYVTFAVPAVLPVNIPPPAFITLPVPAVVVQAPPAGVEFNVVERPTQTFSVPVIAVGFALTVTVAELIQPVPSVYVIFVVPADTPVTTPKASTVPVPVLLVQVPPAGVEFSVVVNPTQTL